MEQIIHLNAKQRPLLHKLTVIYNRILIGQGRREYSYCSHGQFLRRKISLLLNDAIANLKKLLC